jgi:hypothetical protein
VVFTLTAHGETPSTTRLPGFWGSRRLGELGAVGVVGFAPADRLGRLVEQPPGGVELVERADYREHVEQLTVTPFRGPDAVPQMCSRWARIPSSPWTDHPPGAGTGVPTTVKLRWGVQELQLSITNAAPERPPPAPTASTEYGLIGLRERATAVGGHLRTGPLADGGFQVTATLPTATAGNRPEPRDSATVAAIDLEASHGG